MLLRVSKNLAFLCLVSAGLASAQPVGQALFALPAAGSAGTTGSYFAQNSITQLTNFTLPANTIQLLSLPDASKFYAISSSATSPITVLDQNLSNPTSFGSFTTGISKAVLSPDGSKLVVLTGGAVHILSTASGKDLTPAGAVLGTGGIDIAVIQDSRYVFVLGVGPTNQTLLSQIDTAQNRRAILQLVP